MTHKRLNDSVLIFLQKGSGEFVAFDIRSGEFFFLTKRVAMDF